MRDLENAVGQYVVYNAVLKDVEPSRQLYMAVSNVAYANLFEEPFVKRLIEEHSIRLIVFDVLTEVIEQWKD